MTFALAQDAQFSLSYRWSSCIWFSLHDDA